MPIFKSLRPWICESNQQGIARSCAEQGIFKFPSHSERQSIMIRRAGRDGARLPAASRLVNLFKWQAPQARSINQKRALRPELFLGPGQGSGSTALWIPCRKSHPASAYADCSQTPRAGTGWPRGTQIGTTSVLARLLHLCPGAAGTKGRKRRG